MKSITNLLIFLLFFSCNSKSKDSLSYGAKPNDSEDTQENSAKKLIENNCYICHTPVNSQNKRLAPPMEAVKHHYIKDSTTKKEFVKAIQDWVKNPNIKDSKMYGATRRFGLMPKANYSNETIKKIAEYIYDNDLEKPEWFDEHHKKNKKDDK